MFQRTVTALIGIPALIALLWVRGWVASVAVIAFAVVGMYEEYAAFKKKGYRPSMWPGFACAIALWPAYAWKGTAVLLPLMAFGMMLSIFEIVRREKPDWIDAATSIYPIFTAFLPMALFMVMLDEAYQPLGLVLIIFVFVIAFGGDIFAYLVGSTMGKHKLCPAVSPKKTVEGAVGGLVGSAAACLITAFVCRLFGAQTPGYLSVLALAVVGGLAGQIGDLAASLVKRHCGIKDFGSFFPGHGGIMDRLDSVMFTLIVLCSYMLVLA